MSKRCPNCRLVNPANAIQCDCGYDFLSTRCRIPRQVEENTVAPVRFAAGCAVVLIAFGLSIALLVVSLVVEGAFVITVAVLPVMWIFFGIIAYLLFKQ